MGGGYRAILLLAVTACAILLAGCGGHVSIARIQPVDAELPSAITGGAALLPAPSVLLAGLDEAPRRVSAYSETDIIRHGKDYETALLNRNVAVSGNDAEFSTSWSVASGMDPANLGIAMYLFDVPGYDRAPEVRYGWSDAPVDITAAWLGVANFMDDVWEWRRCTAGGAATLADMGPYTSSADQTLVAFVLADEGVSSLRYVRLGPHVLEAQLTADPTLGFAPLAVSLDASTSTTAVGTIDSYEWDEDADGTFGAPVVTATASHNFNDAGAYTPAVRVTSSYGVVQTASVTVTAAGAWEHSWGRDSMDAFWECAVDAAGNVYFAGDACTVGAEYETDLLLMKYSPQGELRWARKWIQAADAGYGEGSGGRSLVLLNDGSIVLTGFVDYQAIGRQNLLLQRWSPDGELIWCKGWQSPDGTTSTGMKLLNHGGGFYVAGNTTAYSGGDLDICLLKIDADGTLQWLVSFAGGDQDWAEDACFTGPMAVSGIAICGYTRSFSAQQDDFLLLRFDLDGVLGWQQRWDAADNQRGFGIGKDLSGNLFVVGQSYEGISTHTDILTLGVNGSGNTVLEAIWATADNESAQGIYVTASGEMFLCGYGYADGSNDTYGILLLLDSLGDQLAAAFYGEASGASERFYSMQRYGDGQALCGIATTAPNAWTTASGYIANALIPDWTATSGTIELRPGEVTYDIAGSVEDASGVLDAGGGNWDCLALTTDFP